MTMLCEPDQDSLKNYLQIENEDSTSKLSKVRAQTGQTDTQTDKTERITTTHLR